MRRNSKTLGRIFYLVFACVAAASCGQTEKHNGWICASLPDLKLTELSELNPQERLDRCLIKWGYRLSHSPDPARTVADATFAACKGLIPEAQRHRVSEWDMNAVAINKDAQKAAGPGNEPKYRQPFANELPPEDSLEAEVIQDAKDQALIAVVQSRAGRCKVPEVV
jgi:hypothetical protein